MVFYLHQQKSTPCKQVENTAGRSRLLTGRGKYIYVPIMFRRGFSTSHCVATMGSITNPAPLNNTTAILDFVFAIRTSLPMHQLLESLHKDGTTTANTIPLALLGFRVCGDEFLVIPLSELLTVKVVDIADQRRLLFLREL